jgi:hypothetical protein
MNRETDDSITSLWNCLYQLLYAVECKLLTMAVNSELVGSIHNLLNSLSGMVAACTSRFINK